MKLVKWISNCRGDANYLVLAGEQAGLRVSVRFRRTIWYVRDFLDNAGGLWLRDWSRYKMEILSSVGIVRSTSSPNPLPQEIVDAINMDFEEIRRTDAGSVIDTFTTGRYIPGEGWIPT